MEETLRRARASPRCTATGEGVAKDRAKEASLLQEACEQLLHRSGRTVTAVRVGVPRPRGDGAVVSVEYVCGNFCGKGFRLEMGRADGAWRVMRSEVAWAS